MQGFRQILFYGVLGSVGLMIGTLIYGMRGGRRTALGLGLSLVALGLVFALAMGHDQGRLALVGAHAKGRIVDIYPAGKAFRPVVEFMTADETIITFDGTTVGDRDTYMMWQEVPVRYLPDDPQQAEIQSWNSLWFPLLIGTVTISVILAIGVLLVWRDHVVHRLKRSPTSAH